MDIAAGTGLAVAVTAARSGFTRGDLVAGDDGYLRAVALADTDALRTELAVEHVAKLLAAGQPTAALRRCDDYLRRLGQHGVLLVQRAEARSALADHAGALEAVRAARSERLTADDTARLFRVEGLAAADRGDLDTAARTLAEARWIFLDEDDHKQVALIDQDLLEIAVRRQETGAAQEVPTTVRTVSDFLLLALALKRELRHDEALKVLLRCVAELDVDRALRLPVLQQITVLLWLTHQDDAARRMLPLLEEAAADSPDPVAAQAEVDRLFPERTLPDSGGPLAERARRLVAEHRLDEAERLLIELRDKASAEYEVANWHLMAGELELQRYKDSSDRVYLEEAVKHLVTAAHRADTVALAELRVFALRLTGRAMAELGKDDQAVEYWVEACRIEEHIAERQQDDDIRVRMLLSVPDEHDERVRAAVDVVDRRGPEAAAAIVVAMEAARGATILGAILPAESGFARNLPRLSDLDGAWRWLAGVTRGLPRSQVVWMMHATPYGVHHAIVGAKVLRHHFVELDINKLTPAVAELLAYTSRKDFLEASAGSGDFERCLDTLATLLDVGTVLDGLAPHVRRIAIVAGGVLSDVPFAGLVDPHTAERIGHRFALSDLPCLSARKPLRRRASTDRGDRTLLVSPPDDTLTEAADLKRKKVETAQELRDELPRRRYRKIRIDSHGAHDPKDPARSWLELAQGRLTAEELGALDVRGTLMLGACESGMAQQRGRDERVGFVRTAVRAGAASVLAARWVAHDPVAAKVLDRFERNLRFLPKDVALQRALRDVGHPAWWACWTLYGDSGWQTSAWPPLRLLRRKLDEWRHRDA